MREKEYNIPGGNAKEDAVSAFQLDYEESMEADEGLLVLDRMKDPQNVITFNALRPGKLRDAFIRRLTSL
jgi:hypothetical protein